MEDLLRPIYQERASHPNTLGILIVEKQKPISPVTDNFDVILFIIVKEAKDPWFMKHYEFENKTAAMHIVDESLLNEWIKTSGYRKVFEWILNGRIVFDRNEYVESLKDKLHSFPEENRELRKVMEFAKLIRSYRECKDLFQSEHYLDAYSQVVRSLHYLARLSVIEKGFHPEVTVWRQVKSIAPEIYKLYQELIESNEPIQKRVELMLLATEFTINTRAPRCSGHLLEVMQTEKEPWTIGDLKLHPEVAPYALDLAALLEYLTEKNIVEVVPVETKGKNVYHRQYKVAQPTA
ncbi:nucleotidyltransferase-like protein [Salirhabdus salicampi]|uniref:nucleotidyltransferase-like protein n=1 Tax=Salirhabdus salicampi TaxID=476102 RepID=UPI0020C2138D|nr:nucleotidyltransferase-like protein [Salirhabdus salicampi]MCP8617991.1 nucleotidyltransferase-like protein [Salirhabdus salicampi]